MPNTSEQIRQLAQAGEPVSQIARTLNVSYQFAYNVCRKAGLVHTKAGAKTGAEAPPHKPSLTVARLLEGGFIECGTWALQENGLALPDLPKVPGVYAFALDGLVQYVGVATRSLARRLYGYARPGPTQKTNQRVNGVLSDLIREGATVAVYCATPPDLDWNGFKVSGAAGLEAGLLLTYDLPWNLRGL